ncbi:hypothetical protein GCM10017044_09140 [Kordiimonas sediminis]|uniref:Uncharacterized protein n=1 Tax=Kordiimonas sediminis TaxID=1735581 RepID=A0A919E6F9_9PROT|nr:SRPBCC family protein [Kordiimonas sediminis]GHF16957.1 hypothetical protein GCM10017044_09140 [Kordiimonas sediminis]
MQRYANRKVKDRFRDWNLLHKSVVIFLWALGFGTALRAYLVVDGGAVELQMEQTLPHGAETIWPWLHDTENRPRWQAHITRVSKLRGDTAAVRSTRLISWRDRGKRWTGVEETVASVPGRLYEVYQESEKDTRRFKVELEPISACQTRVVFTETIRDESYSNRFFGFLQSGDRTERLTISFSALTDWLETTDTGPCSTVSE